MVYTQGRYLKCGNSATSSRYRRGPAAISYSINFCSASIRLMFLSHMAVRVYVLVRASSAFRAAISFNRGSSPISLPNWGRSLSMHIPIRYQRRSVWPPIIMYPSLQGFQAYWLRLGSQEPVLALMLALKPYHVM